MCRRRLRGAERRARGKGRGEGQRRGRRRGGSGTAAPLQALSRPSGRNRCRQHAPCTHPNPPTVVVRHHDGSLAGAELGPAGVLREQPHELPLGPRGVQHRAAVGAVQRGLVAVVEEDHVKGRRLGLGQPPAAHARRVEGGAGPSAGLGRHRGPRRLHVHTLQGSSSQHRSVPHLCTVVRLLPTAATSRYFFSTSSPGWRSRQAPSSPRPAAQRRRSSGKSSHRSCSGPWPAFSPTTSSRSAACRRQVELQGTVWEADATSTSGVEALAWGGRSGQPEETAVARASCSRALVSRLSLLEKKDCR